MRTAEEARASSTPAGASAVTHPYNAMSQLSSRAPGVVGATRADPRIICGLIADGEHAHALAYRAALAKGPRGVALVSDAMPPAAGGPEQFLDRSGLDQVFCFADKKTVWPRDSSVKRASGVQLPARKKGR
jgi:N-acetylglucosamine-6-phosphate deacetylase